jgi:hypothetical protein
MPAILATQEVEMRRITIQSQTYSSQDLIWKIPNHKTGLAEGVKW